MPRRWKWWFAMAFALIAIQAHSLLVGTTTWAVVLQAIDALVLMYGLGWIIGRERATR